MDRGRFTVAPGVLGLIGRAGSSTPGYTFSLTGGDLSQMAAQERFLRTQGMDVGNSDVYPALRTEADYVRALTLIWECRVEGWWNYEHRLVERKICTQTEFDDALGRSNS